MEESKAEDFSKREKQLVLKMGQSFRSKAREATSLNNLPSHHGGQTLATG